VQTKSAYIVGYDSYCFSCACHPSTFAEKFEWIRCAYEIVLSNPWAF